jgi:purine-binding chemotaxis protein CheW
MAMSSTQKLLMGNIDANNTDKYLSFVVGDETYAISILKVKEILEYGGVTPVPMMPKFLRGAINLRGHVVPVVDLAMRLCGEKTNPSRRTCIVIVELKLDESSMDVGLMVDAVSSVQDIDSGNIEEAPSFGGKIDTDYIHGMGKTEDSFVILLNVDRILSMEDIEKLSTAANAQLPEDVEDTE